MKLDDKSLAIELYSDVCCKCKYLIDIRDQTCKAFPRGIPNEIWLGTNDHTKPYKGDQGIQFEAVEKVT